MNRILLIAFACLSVTSNLVAQTTAPDKILMVVSSYGKDSGAIRPGYEFDEFSQAYLIFKANGFEVDVASPKGGVAESDEFNKKKLYNKAVMQDAAAMNLLAHTKPTATINSSNYKAIYIVGGKGAMFDLPFDPSLQDLIVAFSAQPDKVIAAVCHGPAAFIHVKQKDGSSFLAGKQVTGFSNAEELKFGKKWAKEFPFFLEDKLKERGAVYQQSDMMLPQVSRAGNLITGQNPYSTTELAEEIVKALGKKPVQRTLYADEKSMVLVKKAMNNAFDWAKEELKKNTTTYDIELIAVYGYYRLMSENASRDGIIQSLQIIELAKPYMFHEQMSFEMAKGYMKLNNKARAKTLLMEIVEKKPEFKEAVLLLKEIEG